MAKRTSPKGMKTNSRGQRPGNAPIPLTLKGSRTAFLSSVDATPSGSVRLIHGSAFRGRCPAHRNDNFVSTVARIKNPVPTQTPQPKGGSCGVPNALNSRGQVVGESYLSGNLTVRPPLGQEKQTTLVGLGHARRRHAAALWINETGDVIGTPIYPILRDALAAPACTPHFCGRMVS